MTYRVAKALDVLRAELDTAAPDRSIASDGSIGDAAHATRDSDHNPWVIDGDGIGVVRARDFTHDPAHGCDAGKLAEAIRQLGIRGHPALGPGSYVIWDRRIASDTPDGTPWNWEPYGGTNPHDHHCHVSVSLAESGYDSTKSWGVIEKKDGFDMADIKDLERVVRAEGDRILERLVDRLVKQGKTAQERHQRVVESLKRIESETSDDMDAVELRKRLRSLREAVEADGSEPVAADA